MTVGNAQAQERRIESARRTLLARGNRRALRARRARIGSNEREKCLRDARAMAACVHWIDTEKKLRKTLAAGGWNRGWRALWSLIGDYARAEEQKKAGKAGLKRG